LQRAEVDLRASPARELVMAALPGEERPGPAPAVAEEGSAIVPVAITVMVVAVPARPERRIDPEHGIDDLQRFLDHAIVRRAHAVAHQLEETRVHDILRLEAGTRARRPVRHRETGVVGILLRSEIAESDREDPDVVAR